MSCTLPKHEPSLISKKLNLAFESRRVRTQPWTSTSRPIDSARRASATERGEGGGEERGERGEGLGDSGFGAGDSEVDMG